MNKILTLRNWQVFLILIAGLVLANVSIEDNPNLTLVFLLLGMTTYFAWILLTGHGLYQLLPGKIKLNYNLFIVNSGVWLVAYTVIMTISDGKGMTFTGFATLPGFYFFYAFLHFMLFPVRTLKSIELDRRAGISECILDFFLVVFLPIGIWFLQPRINKVAANSEESETNPG
jgi:hypothetical protein